MKECGARKLDATVRPLRLDHLSDAELVRDIAAGSGDALAIVWRRYGPQVHRTLRGCLGTGEHVEDLLQEVFVGLYRNAHNVTEPSRLRAYLIGAAIKKARQTVRDSGRRRRLLSLFAFEQQRVTAPSVQPRDAIRSLWVILEALPVRYRESFMLRYVEDLSIAEVAEIRNVSLATAKRDIGRARERVLLRAHREPALREYLRETVPASEDS